MGFRILVQNGNLSPSLGKAIRRGQKQWQPIVGIEFPCTNEKSCHAVKGPPFLPCGWGGVEGGGGEEGDIFCKLCLVWRVDCPLITFHLDSRYSPFHACFGKCCPPFTHITGPKARNSILQKKTFYFGGASIVSVFWSDAIKLAHCQK